VGSAAPARVHVTTFLFTLGTACFVPAAVGAVVVLPLALNLFGVAAPAERVLAVARWPLLLLAVVLGLALVYRFGPSRRPAERRWVTWGSAFAAALWPEISGARPHWAAVEPPTRAARAGRNAPAFRRSDLVDSTGQGPSFGEKRPFGRGFPPSFHRRSIKLRARSAA
jgi:hypothetical protein